MKRNLHIAIAVVCLSLLAVPALPAFPDPPDHPDSPDSPDHPDHSDSSDQSRLTQSKSEKSKLFDPLDLGLLDPPDRDQWLKPDQVMDALSIAEGSKVADVGAGGGWFTTHLSRRVGPNGAVYAEDIQPEMIEAINRRVQHTNLTNVRAVLGMSNDARLPPNLDAVLISDSYKEMDEPPGSAVPLLRNIARSLKPQGRIGILNFTPGGGGPGPLPGDRVTPEDVIKRAAEAGLELTKREELPPFMYLLVFGRTK